MKGIVCIYSRDKAVLTGDRMKGIVCIYSRDKAVLTGDRMKGIVCIYSRDTAVLTGDRMKGIVCFCKTTDWFKSDFHPVQGSQTEFAVASYPLSSPE